MSSQGERDMAKVTSQEIIDLGFTPEMFQKVDDGSFELLLSGVINEQSLILSGRIGTSSYGSASSPIKDFVKLAEKNLVAAEMVRRRINIVLGNISGSGKEINTSNEKSQRDQYIKEAEDYIAKIVNGASQDSSYFASGALVTSHFEARSA